MVLSSGDQFSRSVVSDSLWPHGLQHARLSCTSPAPGACLNSCSSSRWCHPTISSSVVPFSFRLQSFPASRSFPVSQLFTSGGQSIGILASTSVLPVNILSPMNSVKREWRWRGADDFEACFAFINYSVIIQVEHLEQWHLVNPY